MNDQTATAPAREAPQTQPWRGALIAAGIFVVLLLAIFHQTAWSMVEIWNRDETFAHGYLIAPISAWLIWRQRQHLATIAPIPDLRVLVLLGLAGFGWLLGDLVQAQVVQQLALVAMLITGVWTIVGTRVARAIAFPLGFLFFAVPMGENLIPPLMEFTATFTVEAIRLTGIPIYREGLFFSLPSGNWSVVEACSGVRYLIASVTLGTLYAYLTYHSLKRRLLFILASILVPILANGLRAYGIVMMGHLSGMKLAVGVDHLIYGWIFFGVVMFILFAIGSIWREDDVPPPARREPQPGPDRTANPPALAMAVLASVLVTGAWPALSGLMSQSGEEAIAGSLSLPAEIDQWRRRPDASFPWRPELPEGDLALDSSWQQGDVQVSLFLRDYVIQEQGHEAINNRSFFPRRLLQEEGKKLADVIEVEHRELELGGDRLPLIRVVIKRPQHPMLVWYWYRIGDRHTTNPYQAKLYQAWQRLIFGRPDAALIVVATPILTDRTAAGQRLADFLESALPELEGTLDRVIGR